ncbi:hypothetical protein TNCV_1004371 [Trichonephila clavipes]|nr:hypothetical protein TNCV_1004371 [Trichonephila clavipes]
MVELSLGAEAIPKLASLLAGLLCSHRSRHLDIRIGCVAPDWTIEPIARALFPPDPYTLISGCMANLDSSVDITLPNQTQSDSNTGCTTLIVLLGIGWIMEHKFVVHELTDHSSAALDEQQWQISSYQWPL